MYESRHSIECEEDFKLILFNAVIKYKGIIGIGHFNYQINEILTFNEVVNERICGSY